MSKDFEINCCNKTFSAKRYRVKSYLDDIEKEEFKSIICSVCNTLIIERLRVSKQVDGHSKRYTKRLGGKQAQEYLDDLKKLQKYHKGKKAYYTEIINNTVEHGCKSNMGWVFHEKNTTMKNLNGKTIQADFTPKKELSA